MQELQSEETILLTSCMLSNNVMAHCTIVHSRQLSPSMFAGKSATSRRHRESEGITQIIRIHTDKHRSVLAEIDDAIQAVLETGELPLFENGKLI